MKKPLTVLLLLASLLLPACQTNPYAPVPRQLALTVRVFESTVRWGELTEMYDFGKHGETQEVQQGLQNVRVTGYESTQNSFNAETFGNRAEPQHYYHRNSDGSANAVAATAAAAQPAVH